MNPDNKINLRESSFLYICICCMAVSTCWFCLNSMRASWTMYFLSVSVSPATPVCACQVLATRNNLEYNDKTTLRVEAIYKTKDCYKTNNQKNLEKGAGWALQFLFWRIPHSHQQTSKTTLLCSNAFLFLRSEICKVVSMKSLYTMYIYNVYCD